MPYRPQAIFSHKSSSILLFLSGALSLTTAYPAFAETSLSFTEQSIAMEAPRSLDLALNRKKRKRKKKEKSVINAVSNEDNGAYETVESTPSNLYLTPPNIFSNPVSPEAVPTAKSKQKEIYLELLYGSAKSTANFDGISFEATHQILGLSSLMVIPVGPVNLGSGFSYSAASGNNKVEEISTTETSTPTLNLTLPIAYRALPFLDLGITPIYHIETEKEKRTSAKTDISSTNTTKYSYLSYAIGLALHSQLYEAGFKFQPGIKVTGTSTDLSDEPSSSKPIQHIPTAWELTTRYLISPKFFAGFNYSKNAAASSQGNYIGLELGVKPGSGQIALQVATGTDKNEYEESRLDTKMFAIKTNLLANNRSIFAGSFFYYATTSPKNAQKTSLFGAAIEGNFAF